MTDCFLIASTWCSLQSYSENLAPYSLWKALDEPAPCTRCACDSCTVICQVSIRHLSAHSTRCGCGLTPWTEAQSPQGKGSELQRQEGLEHVNLCECVSPFRVKLFPENKLYQKNNSGLLLGNVKAHFREKIEFFSWERNHYFWTESFLTLSQKQSKWRWMSEQENVGRVHKAQPCPRMTYLRMTKEGLEGQAFKSPKESPYDNYISIKPGKG